MAEAGRPDGARPILRAVRALARRVTDALGLLQRARADILARHGEMVDGLVDAQLSVLPLEALRAASDGRLNLAALQAAGYRRVGELLSAREADLTRLPGVGPVTARAVVAAVAGLRGSVAEETRFRIELDPSDQAATRLLQALQRYDLLRREASGASEQIADLALRLPAEVATAAPAANPVRWLLTGQQRRESAAAAVSRLGEVLRWAEEAGLAERLGRLERAARAPAVDPWQDFELRASDYYALLSEFVATPAPTDAGQGFLTEDVVADVEAQELDGRLRRVDLRGYQSFGSRFALARRRVIIGDEMGLGKTIQALAAICHLRVTDPGPVLVVCPASVMANWEREVEHRTALAGLTLHGPDRQDEVTQWLTEGPVGITTYDTLSRLELPHDLRLAALVVDEAHYVKNPATVRSRSVRRLAGRADHVWFLTGTPMENTVDEFATLIRYLQSDLVPSDGLPAGSVTFRRQVSPVYLRRNAEDVLVELPPRQEIAEWVYFTEPDRTRYAAAVRSGNLMAIRSAGFGAPSCAKLDRLRELFAEAAANRLKVVVYSFFLDVLGWARTVADTPVFGPLTGGVPPVERQAIVDAFTAHPGPGVLFAQIQAGGVGLNLQAASVVVLCEPQLTPTSEEQAIARAHRMGQVRPVQVHRLLAVDSVDERIVQLLAGKRADFDAFARRSELAESSAAAVDVTFGDLGRHLVHAEQARHLR